MAIEDAIRVPPRWHGDVGYDSLHRDFAAGNPGDVRPAGGGISELRIDYGPGYRLYYVQLGEKAVVLWGGDKDTQDRDIAKAKELLNEYKE